MLIGLGPSGDLVRCYDLLRCNDPEQMTGTCRGIPGTRPPEQYDYRAMVRPPGASTPVVALEAIAALAFGDPRPWKKPAAL
jgi:hypothetical protein